MSFLPRKSGNFFRTNSFIDSLFKDGKFNKQAFLDLLNSLYFPADLNDKATSDLPGIVRIANAEEVISKPVYPKGNNTVVPAIYQLSDTVAEDATVVITEVIWNVTDSVIASDTSDTSKVYRKRYLAKTNPSTTPQFDTFQSVVAQTVYTLDGTAGMPNLIGRNIQLLTLSTSVLSDAGGTPDFTFVSGTGVLTFTFGITDISQIRLISTA